MIVDTSALIAVLRREDDARRYQQALFDAAPTEAGGPRISAANYLEAAIVTDRSPDAVDRSRLDTLLQLNRISIAPVTGAQVRLARQAYRDFGRGSGHRARLNFGDCFAYALARESDEPLLFKGDDFPHTDVRRAL